MHYSSLVTHPTMPLHIFFIELIHMVILEITRKYPLRRYFLDQSSEQRRGTVQNFGGAVENAR